MDKFATEKLMEYSTKRFFFTLNRTKKDTYEVAVGTFNWDGRRIESRKAMPLSKIDLERILDKCSRLYGDLENKRNNFDNFEEES